MNLEDLKRIAKDTKYMRMRPITNSMESIKNDAIMVNNLKSYKLMYGNGAANKLFKMECENKLYREKISVCEYFIKELLDKVEKCDDNQKLIDETNKFLTYIYEL